MDTTNALTTVPALLDSDVKMIGAWLDTKRSDQTRRVYARYVLGTRPNERLATNGFVGLLQYAGVGLQALRINDLQAYIEQLECEPATTALATNVFKSLYTFLSDYDYARNIAHALKPPALSDDLAQRILSEADCIRLIDRETDQRNHAMLHLLYHAGLRVSEVVNLQWSQVRPSDNGAVLDIQLAKSGNRRVLISAGMLSELMALPRLGSYVFQSRKRLAGLPMTIRQVDVIVLAAAQRAGIAGNVSAHWLRHSHATHAIHNHARPEVIQRTLGHKNLNTTMRYVHLNPDESSSQFIKV